MGYLGCVVDSCREQFDRPVTLAVHILSHELHDCEFCKQRYTEIQHHLSMHTHEIQHHLSTHTAEIQHHLSTHTDKMQHNLSSHIGDIKVEQVSNKTDIIQQHESMYDAVTQDHEKYLSSHIFDIKVEQVSTQPADISTQPSHSSLHLEHPDVYDEDTDSDGNGNDQLDATETASSSREKVTNAVFSRAESETQPHLFKCRICGALRVTKASLRTHMNKKHLLNRQTYKLQRIDGHSCHYCGKAYYNNVTLRLHIVLKHEGMVFHDCKMCAFNSTSEGLERHMAMAHGENNSVDMPKCSRRVGVVNSSQDNEADKYSDRKKMAANLNAGGSVQGDFTCIFCHKNFTSMLRLRVHLLIHNRLKPMGATSCDIRQNTLADLTILKRRSRKRQAHKPQSTRKHICAYCSKAYCKERQLRDHIVSCHESLVFHGCKICGFNSTVKGLERHMEMVHGEDSSVAVLNESSAAANLSPDNQIKSKSVVGANVLTCILCQMTFDNQHYLKKHILIHDRTSNVRRKPEKNSSFSCDICGLTTKHKSRLRTHIFRHLPKEIKCGKCSKLFATLNDVHIHSTVHIPPQHRPQHICEICGASYARKFTLNAHMRNKHAPTEAKAKRHACQTCGKAFARLDHLRKHAITHEARSYVYCNLCGKKYNDALNLTSHIRFKHEGKGFTCDVCNKSFMCASYLADHKRMHTGDSPFPCQLCGKSFKSKVLLRCHVKIHDGKKPHLCDHCGKAFRLQGQLTQHLKSHSDLRQCLCIPTSPGVSHYGAAFVN